MWNKLRYFVCSLFRRFQLLLGNLAVILLAVCLPLSASADTISFKPTFSTAESNFLNVDNSYTNYLETQYTYGGTYNPLILGCETAHSWVRAIAAVRWNFGKTLPAGTEITIQCAGWHNKSYSLNGKHMYVSLTSPTSHSNYQTFLAERAVLPFNNGDNYVQTSNGVYRGYLCSGKYVLPADTSYIYLVWDITLSGTRNGTTYVGISLSSVSYQGTYISPAESEIYGTPESGALDDTSAALGDLDNAESALLDANSSGLDYAASQIQNAGGAIAQFHNSLQAVSYMFTQLLGRVPIFGYLLTISVSLGLIMLLFGLLGEVSSFSRFSFSRKESRIRRMDRERERSLSGRKLEQENRSKKGD